MVVGIEFLSQKISNLLDKKARTSQLDRQTDKLMHMHAQGQKKKKKKNHRDRKINRRKEKYRLLIVKIAVNFYHK